MEYYTISHHLAPGKSFAPLVANTLQKSYGMLARSADGPNNTRQQSALGKILLTKDLSGSVFFISFRLRRLWVF